MPAIKWENYRVATTALLNQIVIGKTDKKGQFLTDRSDDRTKEVIIAVKQHMETKFNTDKNKDNSVTCTEYKFNNGSKIIYYPPVAEGMTKE
jgi:hypothetical protein